MNKTYRLIWSEITQSWVAVSELAKARSKRASGVCCAALPVTAAASTTRQSSRLQPAILAWAVACAVSPMLAFAADPAPTQLPTNGQVVAGQASISQNAAVMNINQGTNRAAIDWATFNVGSAATVNFNQPSASSVTLNRVLDPNPSQIFGRINATGQVFLTNPGGIYFAPGASVDVGGLVATTHSISNEDFMAGRDNFTRSGATGSIVNEGELKAALGGYIALLAPEVRNLGVIVAQMGTVALAAGEAYELQFDGNNTLANLRVEPATIAALVENGNAVRAPGGLIILSAQAAGRLQGGVIRNTGAIEATGLTSNGGVIRLEASDGILHTGAISADAAPNSAGKGGTVTLIASLANHDSRTEINGGISARGGDLGGDGGFIETSAGRVKIGGNTRVDTRAPQGKTGTWLLDPTDYTIDSVANSGDETGAQVSSSLALTDRVIMVADNIHVNEAVTWSANTLTLSTTNGDVNINAVMTAKDTASLDLEPGSGKVNVGFNPDGTFKGRVDFFLADGITPRSGTGFLTIGGAGYTVITSLGADHTSTTGADLQGINLTLTGNFALGSNIDAGATSGWDDDGFGVKQGFVPIGSSSSPFSGKFDGLGHSISNLTINRPTTYDVGLFGHTNGSILRNVGLTNVSITGAGSTGGLVGFAEHGTISNSYATATPQAT